MGCFLTNGKKDYVQNFQHLCLSIDNLIENNYNNGVELDELFTKTVENDKYNIGNKT